MSKQRHEHVRSTAPHALICHTAQGAALLVWAGDPVAGRALATYAEDIAAEDQKLSEQIRRECLERQGVK